MASSTSALRKSARSASGHSPTHRMAPFARVRAGAPHAGAYLAQSPVQSLHQIVGQERAVALYTHHPFDAVALRRQPVESGQDASERTGKAGHAVTDHRQPGIGEALGVAVGAYDDAGALRRQAGQYAVENAGMK